MRYLNEICTTYSVVIKGFNHIEFVYLEYPVDEVLLNESLKFLNQWIGRVGPIPCPFHSPNISTLDFFLWCYVQDIVYRTKI